MSMKPIFALLFVSYVIAPKANLSNGIDILSGPEIQRHYFDLTKECTEGTSDFCAPPNPFVDPIHVKNSFFRAIKTDKPQVPCSQQVPVGELHVMMHGFDKDTAKKGVMYVSSAGILCGVEEEVEGMNREFKFSILAGMFNMHQNTLEIAIHTTGLAAEVRTLINDIIRIVLVDPKNPLICFRSYNAQSPTFMMTSESLEAMGDISKFLVKYVPAQLESQMHVINHEPVTIDLNQVAIGGMPERGRGSGLKVTVAYDTIYRGFNLVPFIVMPNGQLLNDKRGRDIIKNVMARSYNSQWLYQSVSGIHWRDISLVFSLYGLLRQCGINMQDILSISSLFPEIAGEFNANFSQEVIDKNISMVQWLKEELAKIPAGQISSTKDLCDQFKLMQTDNAA